MSGWWRSTAWDSETLTLGSGQIEIFHTPGHTPDSMCLRVPGAVLTGDTLLIGGSGRTDFPGGDAGAQYDAVTQRLFALPGETTVWPGHDYKGQTCSTIDRERLTNPRFANTTREQYVEKMGNLGLSFPDRIQEVLQVNQSGFEAEEVHFPRVADIAAVPEIVVVSAVSCRAKPATAGLNPKVKVWLPLAAFVSETCVPPVANAQVTVFGPP